METMLCSTLCTIVSLLANNDKSQFHTLPLWIFLRRINFKGRMWENYTALVICSDSFTPT